MRDHSLEEIRNALKDILTENVRRDPKNCSGYYGDLKSAVGQFFEEKQPAPSTRGMVTRTYSLGSDSSLSGSDANLLLEIFWEFVRHGILCFKLEDMHRGQVVYRITQRGQQYLSGGNPYHFHDGASYASLFESRIPNIHPITLAYLREAGQAYTMECFLAAAVTLTAALDHSLGLLFDAVESNETHAKVFASVKRHKELSNKLQALIQVIKTNPEIVSSPVGDDLETSLSAVTAMIWRVRDNTAESIEKMRSHENCTLFLQLLIPCCQKIYRLMEALS